MVPSLSPPTDNLYKFMAIAGLVLILSSVYLFESTRDDALAASLSLQREALASQLEEARLSFAIAELEWEVARERAAVQNGGIDDEQRRASSYLPEELARVRQTSDSLSHARSGFLDALGSRVDRNRRNFWIGTLLMILGVALATWGFVLWWARVQRYQDILTRVAAVEAQRRL